uniref:Uncharacterized protein n=1 Tax=Oryza meridionalis TaxID=40149 RepID=A0A0E0CJS9_9ORYZ
MGTERKRKTSVSAKLGRAATTNGTAAAAAAAAVANQPLIGEVPRVPRHSRSAARSPCDSRRTISSPSSTTTRPSSSSEKPEAASTQMESHHSTSTPKSIDPPPSVQGSGTPGFNTEWTKCSSHCHRRLPWGMSSSVGFQYGVEKVCSGHCRHCLPRDSKLQQADIASNVLS